MKSEEHQFCPQCGSQVFAKDEEQEEGSTYYGALECGACEWNGSPIQTFHVIKSFHPSGNTRMRFIKFPVTYMAPPIEDGNE